MGENTRSRAKVPSAQCSSCWPNTFPALRFFLRQLNYVDYMIDEFPVKELMRKSQFHPHFHLPVRIITL